VIYFKGGKEVITVESHQLDSIPKYKIQIGDVLNVQSSNTVIGKEELVNKKLNEEAGTDENEGYIVNDKGLIELPLIGSINVVGLSISQANDSIKNKFGEYLNFTYVNTTLSNNKITILGEVKNPGTQKIVGENVTIFEALGLAGDLTDFGNRENVRILRKINNETKIYIVDVSKTELISSNVYYILPNDIIYVEPMKVKLFKLNASSISLILSAISITLLLIARSKGL